MNSVSPKILRALQEERIITLSFKLQKQLSHKGAIVGMAPLIEARKGFRCPYFRHEAMPCKFYLCGYNSAIIKRTACLLSSNKETSITELAIAKNIRRKNLLKLVVNIEAGQKWDRVQARIEGLLENYEICKDCGHFASECRGDSGSCGKRVQALKEFKEESLLPKSILSYPMALIILSTFKEFGDWAKLLFPKKQLNLWLNTLERGHYGKTRFDGANQKRGSNLRIKQKQTKRRCDNNGIPARRTAILNRGAKNLGAHMHNGPS